MSFWRELAGLASVFIAAYLGATAVVLWRLSRSRKQILEERRRNL